MTCKKAVFLEYNVVLSPLICSTFFGLDTAGCWVSSPSLAKHGSVCYLLITVWHKIKCSAEGRPKCQHLTGWSPPAFMSWPWYTAWYMILLGNIYIFFKIKWSSSWLKVNEIFTKKQETSYTGCVNLSVQKYFTFVYHQYSTPKSNSKSHHFNRKLQHWKTGLL